MTLSIMFARLSHSHLLRLWEHLIKSQGPWFITYYFSNTKCVVDESIFRSQIDANEITLYIINHLVSPLISKTSLLSFWLITHQSLLIKSMNNYLNMPLACNNLKLGLITLWSLLMLPTNFPLLNLEIENPIVNDILYEFYEMLICLSFTNIDLQASTAFPTIKVGANFAFNRIILLMFVSL